MTTPARAPGTGRSFLTRSTCGTLHQQQAIAGLAVFPAGRFWPANPCGSRK